jgi:hypothetical protein
LGGVGRSRGSHRRRGRSILGEVGASEYAGEFAHFAGSGSSGSLRLQRLLDRWAVRHGSDGRLAEAREIGLGGRLRRRRGSGWAGGLEHPGEFSGRGGGAWLHGRRRRGGGRLRWRRSLEHPGELAGSGCGRCGCLRSGCGWRGWWGRSGSRGARRRGLKCSRKFSGRRDVGRRCCHGWRGSLEHLGEFSSGRGGGNGRGCRRRSRAHRHGRLEHSGELAGSGCGWSGRWGRSRGHLQCLLLLGGRGRRRRGRRERERGSFEQVGELLVQRLMTGRARRRHHFPRACTAKSLALRQVGRLDDRGNGWRRGQRRRRAGRFPGYPFAKTGVPKKRLGDHIRRALMVSAIDNRGALRLAD